MAVEVRVSKKGPTGGPHAEVLVDGKITASQLGALVQNVTTNKAVLSAAGLRACGGSKLGRELYINVLLPHNINSAVAGAGRCGGGSPAACRSGSPLTPPVSLLRARHL